MTQLRIPDFEERARLAARAAKAGREGEKVRRIKKACGHEQAHVIGDGFLAKQEYSALAQQPCGACDRHDLADYDGPDVPEEGDDVLN